MNVSGGHVQGSGFGVWGLGLQGLGFGVWGLELTCAPSSCALFVPTLLERRSTSGGALGSRGRFESAIQEQLLSRNVEQFRGSLYLRLIDFVSLNSRLESNKKEEEEEASSLCVKGHRTLAPPQSPTHPLAYSITHPALNNSQTRTHIAETDDSYA